MQLLVSADIHLGSPIRSAAMRNPDLGERLRRASRDTFAGIVDLAISDDVDVLVLAGDIFDNDIPDLRSRAFLITQLARAAEAGIPTVLIRGNHDALLDHCAHGDLGPKIHLLHKDMPSVEIDSVAFHGLSFDKAHVSKSFLPGFPSPVMGRLNVGLMHTSLGGSPSHDPYAPCNEQDLMMHGFDLWCLGHIHTPFERVSGSTLAVMPGIPQPRHFGERSGGSVTLVTLGDGPPEFLRRDVAQLRFAECDLDVSHCSDQQDLLRELRASLMKTGHSHQDTAVRLRVQTSRYTTEELTVLATEVLEGIDRVYLDKVQSSAPVGQIESRADDLLRLMREEMREPGFRFTVKEVLEDFQAALPRDIADELAEDAIDDLLMEAINEVSLSLHSEEVQ
jgi:DNA repair protein SbcD/Mre11